MNILIVDDNQVYLNSIKRMVTEICEKNGIEVAVRVTNIPESVLKEQMYLHNDIILLDIDMPTLSGIEIAAEINEVKKYSDKPYLVFVSCMEGLIFEALKKLPYSFIRKGFEKDLESVLVSINEKLKIKKTYTIKVGRHIETLLIDEIVYLEKKNNYVIFHTVSGDYRERVKIEDKYSDLSSFGFVRPQIGYVVNIKYIYDLQLSSVVLDNGVNIPLSKKYRKELKNNYYDWMVKRK